MDGEIELHKESHELSTCRNIGVNRLLLWCWMMVYSSICTAFAARYDVGLRKQRPLTKRWSRQANCLLLRVLWSGILD